MPKKIIQVVVFVVAFFLLVESSSSVHAQVDPNLNQRLQNAPIIVDHNSIALFNQIPDIYIQRAENIRLMFGNRSVGVNTNESLNCLTFESDDYCRTHRGPFPTGCPNDCSTYTHPDPLYNSPPESIDWYRSGGYNRTNWVHAIFATGWKDMATKYMGWLSQNPPLVHPLDPAHEEIPNPLSLYDVYTFQFSYLNVNEVDVNEDNDIDNQPGGFISRRDGANNDIYDLDALVSRFNDKFFVYQTTSLAPPIGTSTSTEFNRQMRDFVKERDSRGQYRILLDFADVESHDPWGNPCIDSKDGVCWCVSTNQCEDYSHYVPPHACDWNDGVQYPAICRHYATEPINGHLAGGGARIRIAKSYWVLMAQIAGWNPGSTTTPTPPSSTPTPTRTPTPVPPTPTPSPSIPASPTPTVMVPTPTPTPIPGDVDGSGQVNVNDLNTLLAIFGVRNTESRFDPLADLDDSGEINVGDLNRLLTNFGR